MTEAMTKCDKKWKKWLQQYEKLVEFKRSNGHCIVPKRYERDASLGRWIGEQRFNHKNNKILKDRKDLLDDIGFVWKVDFALWKADSNLQWNMKYAKLLEFKRKNGHCLVPKGYQQDKSLGKWVSAQRTFHTRNTLRQDRKELLITLNFGWKPINLTVRRPSTLDDDVRSFVFLRSFHGWLSEGLTVFLTLVLFLLFTCVGFGFGSVDHEYEFPKRSNTRAGISARPL